MKKFIAGTFLFFVSAFTLHINANAQDNNKMPYVTSMLDMNNYTFVARTATPMKGGAKQLATYYSLQITQDSLISHLPYFGRAYSAPVNSADAGMDFISTSFDYAVNREKKSGWQVTIKPKDNNTIQQMILQISKTEVLLFKLPA